ncbi:MAG: site-specific integrase [Planctomycetaceae bacterium]|nr:site-specific integrase [Planctomycetaceae bacterium]
MVLAAAHTGARRSELIRTEVRDVDFASGTLVLREKKRNRDKRTFRRVPLAPQLRAVLTDWVETRRDGRHLSCIDESLPQGGKRRDAPMELTVDEATDHFNRTFSGSKWQVLRVWHVLRHSFAFTPTTLPAGSKGRPPPPQEEEGAARGRATLRQRVQ